MSKRTTPTFSLVIGGPFWRLQRRLGLLGPDRLPRTSTALLLAAIAWLPAALLSLADGTVWNETLGGRSFLLDFTAYARFIVAIVVLVFTERVAEVRGAALVRQFSDAELVAPDDRTAFTAAMRRADRRSSSALAEVIILGIAYGASVHGLFLQVSELDRSWIGNLVDGHTQLSFAGWWMLLVSLPLFWFLVLRWFWRFAILTRLLWDFAALNLRLVATHPDRSGGLGFLGLYPPIFAALVFALSCVTASAALEVILFAGWSLRSLVAPFLVWVALVLIFFVGPLTVFAPALANLKRRALLAYSVFACEHNRAFERKWVQRAKAGPDALGTPDSSSLTDLTTAVQSIRAMRLIPAGSETFVPLLIATVLPWLAVLTTQIPLVELLTMIVKALL